MKIIILNLHFFYSSYIIQDSKCEGKECDKADVSNSQDPKCNTIQECKDNFLPSIGSFQIKLWHKIETYLERIKVENLPEHYEDILVEAFTTKMFFPKHVTKDPFQLLKSWNFSDEKSSEIIEKLSLITTNCLKDLKSELKLISKQYGLNGEDVYTYLLSEEY